MKCKVDENLIYDYLERELDQLSVLILEEHIKQCDECRQKSAEIKQLLFEFDRISDNDIDIPKDLNTVFKEAYNSYLDLEQEKSEKNKFGLRDYYNIQKNSLTFTGRYIKYIPGVNFSKKVIGFISNKAIKTSESMLKSGVKLVLTKGYKKWEFYLQL